MKKRKIDPKYITALHVRVTGRDVNRLVLVKEQNLKLARITAESEKQRFASAEMTVVEIAEIVSECTKANSDINKYDYLTQIQNYQECMIQISRVLLDYFSMEDGRC